jgi:L-fucose isomerase-like protein
LATSEYGDLQQYMPIFRTIYHMRKSKVLLVRQSDDRKELAAAFQKQFGTTIQPLSYEQLKAAYDSVDVRKAEQAAQEFIKGAVKILEPKPAQVTDALRFYFAVLDILKREKANAITIDCLGGFARGQLPAYPCVAWSKLNDQGMYGVCESDLYSTMTQLLVTSYCGKPGFVSDPVFDTSRNELIHAHCVAATAMQGIGAPTSPYIIRSHAEDKQGVSMQVLMPTGQTVTLGKFADARNFMVSTAEVIENVDHPSACRTKIRTHVSDARKMLEQYAGSLHRVAFYGDYVKAIESMGRLMGFQVTREM